MRSRDFELLQTSSLLLENCEYKGRFTLIQIINVLSSNNIIVNDDDIVNVLRYDKSLRDCLYVYLATLEEYLKSKILNAFDVKHTKDYRYYKELIKDVKSIENTLDSVLYYGFKLDLHNIIEFLNVKEMIDKKEYQKLMNIKRLRNDVMHHNMVLLGNSKTFDDFEKHKINLTNKLNDLILSLPEKYRDSLKERLNNQIGRRRQRHIKLEDF